MWRLPRNLNTRMQTLTSATTPIIVIMIGPTVRESLPTLETMLQAQWRKLTQTGPHISTK